MKMSRFDISPKVSFRLKAHDFQSLEAFLLYLFELFIDLGKFDTNTLTFDWVSTMKEHMAEFSAHSQDADDALFWKAFRNVTGGFRALEGALNDRGPDFESRVSFDPPQFRSFRVVLRDRRTNRYLEAVVRPKSSETIDMRCCVNTDPVDKLDVLREKAESLQDASVSLGLLTVVEILELVNGCVQDGKFE